MSQATPCGYRVSVVQCIPSCYIAHLQRGRFSWKVHPDALYSKSYCLHVRLSLQADLLTGVELDKFKTLVLLSLRVLPIQLNHFIFLFGCLWFSEQRTCFSAVEPSKLRWLDFVSLSALISTRVYAIYNPCKGW